jgi:dTDP-4-amino-4,6-dideoxygalactose transaminase
MSLLALHGGPKTISRAFPRYNPIGGEEIAAATRVLESGVLSKFLGCWDPDFYGGPKVQGFERACEAAFGVKHAVSVNSCTSGLIAALGAAGVQPGDEVIVPPWTMSATATAALVWNAIPVFADIEPETFNLDIAAVEKRITSRTRAIVVADIFGHAADLDGLMALAARHRLVLIEDCAQSPWARYKGRFAGTVAHIGAFSLNYHKHVHTGEGGFCLTNDPRLAERMQLIRNHAEAVVADKGERDLTNMIGFNFRMGEIEAAIATEQLRKLPALAASREAAGARLTQGLAGLKGLRPAIVKEACSHVFYVYPCVLDQAETQVPRSALIEALAAEGVPGLMPGYTNIHLLPIYQKRIAYGSKGFPWAGGAYEGNVSYAKGICPVAESLHERAFLGLEFCLHGYAADEVDLVSQAFRKVWQHLPALRESCALVR